MKKDPYKHKKFYLAWKEKCSKRIPDISEINSRVILDYIYDMEHGLNVGRSSKKGARSFNRLNNIRQRLVFLTKKFEELYKTTDITKLDERILHKFFTDMRNGVIRRIDGDIYKDPANFVKLFKAFWHWHQKINRKKGIDLYDITQDLDTSKEKPRWVYLTEEQVKLLHDNANYFYKVLIMFLFDTGIRAPGELINIRVSDFHNNFKELNIRDEISKTFGRRIKLMICSDIIRDYIKNEGLKDDDYVFQRTPQTMNRYLKRHSKRILGDEKSPAGQRYSDLTLYDFRHCSCCYWMPRYKSESALKYRFGWKRTDKIHYYSELLGMRDTISEEDMLMDVTKTEIEKQLTKTEHKNDILKERIEMLEKQMKVLSHVIKREIVVVEAG